MTILAFWVLLAGLLNYQASATMFGVTHTGDSGPGSLRQAMTDANNQAGPDTIIFNLVPAADHTITLVTRLPPIIETVAIDGTTHPDGRVELKGVNLPTTGIVNPAFWIQTDGCLIRGFAMHGFKAIAIHISTGNNNLIENNYIGTDYSGNGLGDVTGVGVNVIGSGNVIGGTLPTQRNIIAGCTGSGVDLNGATSVGNRVEGNYIGTDRLGAMNLGNVVGISVSYGTVNVIGGSTPGAGNLISGNSLAGILILNGKVRVEGNRIGTDAAGTSPIGNQTGISISAFAAANSDNVIGGASVGARNIVSGNTGSGILVIGGMNQIRGNFIGTDVTGSTPLGNGGNGILHTPGFVGQTYINVIGGLTLGEGNTIAYNALAGVSAFTPGTIIIRDTILGNSIHGNGGPGINLGGTPNDPQDADTGVNKLQNFPTIISATIIGSDLQIQYSIDSAQANANYDDGVGQAGLIAEFFKADSANQEGEVFLGRDRYTAANYNTGTLPGVKTVTLAGAGSLMSAASRVVATATDEDGNTSEFSVNSPVSGTPPVLICAADKTVNCGSVWSFDSPTASATCGGTSVTVTILSTVTTGLCPKVITRTWQATDSCGNSATCSQTVTVLGTSLAITSQPQSQTANAGWSVTFSVAATGCPQPLTYQWQKTGVNLTGQTSATLVLSNVQSADAGNYTVVVGNGALVVTSNPAILTVVVPPAPCVAGEIWTARETDRNWVSVASSADGTKLVAAVGPGLIYTSTDSGVTWTPRASNRSWQAVASSADGVMLVAAEAGGQIYTSADSGANWTPRESSRVWISIASSADGSKLAAVVQNGPIYTSADSGVTWTPHASNQSWASIASSADGSKLVAVVTNGQIYTSTSFGVTWTPSEINRQWMSVASSADGSKLAAVVSGGKIYTSTDFGANWVPHASDQDWHSVASSADGGKLVAAVINGQIYTSTDSGMTWTPHENNRRWYSVASSADGTKLVAVVGGGTTGQIYTSGCSEPINISGQKFNDYNGNGVRDAGEPGLQGWTMQLSNGQSTVTDVNGNYSFLNLAPGTYTVSEVQQSGWMQTAPSGGSYTVILGTSGSIGPFLVNEQAKLTASDKAVTDGFGFSVALSGDTALVGAWQADAGGLSNAGAAYVFVRNGISWTQQAKLIASSQALEDWFGFSVALSGDTALVGAWQAGFSGAAYVFVRTGSSWTQQAILTASDQTVLNGFGVSIVKSFGYSVALSGGTAVVGAEGADLGGNILAGAAYVFVRSGTSWTEQAKLTASNHATEDRFGAAVSLSADTALIGAYQADPGGLSNAGAAYLFVRSGTSWTEQAILTASNKAADDRFGASVSVSGDTALVGAWQADPGSLNGAGASYVFVRSLTSWTEQAILTASNKAAGDAFGRSVSLSGDTALIGAYQANPSGLSDAGASYVFVRGGTSWTEQAILTASDKAAGDFFGGVALSGDTVLVGAQGADPDGVNFAGAAYVSTFTPITSGLNFGNLQTGMPPVPMGNCIRADFNIDGWSDILFQDSGGFLAVWLMNGLNLLSSGFLTPSNPGIGWRVADTGDFNNDVHVDVLFQHSDGTLGVWFMNGMSLGAPSLLSPSNPGPGWSAVCGADFNNDGQEDVLFQHANGDLAVWLMNGVTIQNGQYLNPQNPGAGWSAVGTGDFNGDGHEDVLFQHSDDTLAVWFMNGTSQVGVSWLSPANPGVSWRVVGVADRNQDGQCDLLFQHAMNGDLAVWFMNGIAMQSAHYLNPQNPGGTWKVVAPK